MAIHIFSQEVINLLMACSSYASVEAYEAAIDKKYPVGYPDRDYYRGAYKRAPHNCVTATIDGSSVTTSGNLITLSVFGTTVVQFYLENYPACCGAKMVHHFCCDHHISPDKLNPLLDQVFSELRDLGYLRCNDRLIVVMVEARGIPGLDNQGTSERMVMDLKPVKNPSIIFKPLWDYFHSQLKVNTRLMYNNNSGNVLHDMEVILK